MSIIEEDKSRKDADRIWQEALGQLQLQVSRSYYDTWLKNTVALGIDGDTLAIGALSTFHVEHLEKRLYRLVEGVVLTVSRRPLTLKFQVFRPPSTRAELVEFQYPGLSEGQFENGAESGSSSQHPSSLNPRYTFERFVVGRSNNFAYASATAASENPGVLYNPLYLYSPVGLGKTHLLHAIGHRLAQKGLRVLFVSAEQFTNDFVQSIQERRTREFRDKYRELDVLLLDDIQFFRGKEETERGFFHVFNDLHGKDRQVVVASDRPPKALTLVEERLRSRFEGGLKADIHPPDFETRVAIIKTKAEELKVILDTASAGLIARRSESNIRDLEGALKRVIIYAQLAKTSITKELCQKALADTPSDSPEQMQPSDIIKTIASFYGLSPRAITGASRVKKIARARQIAMYVLREELHLSLQAIGREFSDRDHSSVAEAQAHIDLLIQNDPLIREELLSLHEHMAPTLKT